MRQVVRYRQSVHGKNLFIVTSYGETMWLPTCKEFKNIGSPLWGLPPQLAKRDIQVLAEQQLFLAPITVTCVGALLPAKKLLH